MVVPTKATTLQKLEGAHRDALRVLAALQQQAQVMEARAVAAEGRLTLGTNAANGDQGEGKQSVADAQRLQQALQENERLHAQLARANIQLTDADRSTSMLKIRITELEIELERATQNEKASKTQRQTAEQQIKSLRASIRALEKELISTAAGYT